MGRKRGGGKVKLGGEIGGRKRGGDSAIGKREMTWRER